MVQPKLGHYFKRNNGKDVKIIETGPHNAVGVSSDGRFYLFDLNGRGVGNTGDLLEICHGT